MTRSTTLAVLVASTLAAVAAPASAGCGGGGGGFRVSIGGGGHYRHHAPVHRAPAYHAPIHRPRPVYAQPVAPRPVIQQPIVQQPIAPQPAPTFQQPAVAPQQAAPVAPAVSPEQSALNALMAFGGQPAAAPQQPTHVGVWTATVNGSNRVSLQLDASGAFRWTANSGGKTSSFAGSYTITGGQLTLVRGDNQQLAGAWTADTAGGFRFKLASAQDNGLLFVRG